MPLKRPPRPVGEEPRTPTAPGIEIGGAEDAGLGGAVWRGEQAAVALKAGIGAEGCGPQRRNAGRAAFADERGARSAGAVDARP